MPETPAIAHLIVTQLQMIEEEPPTMGAQLLTGHITIKEGNTISMQSITLHYKLGKCINQSINTTLI